jgi:hypothetical protein
VDIPGGTSRQWARAPGQRKEALPLVGALGDRHDRSAEVPIVRVPQFDPRKFCAHLGEQAARRGRVDLALKLVRCSVAPRAPSQLAATVNALVSASREQTVLVINPLGHAPKLPEEVTERTGGSLITLPTQVAQ